MKLSEIGSAPPPDEAHPGRRFMVILACLGLASVLLHGAFLHAVARVSDAAQASYYTGADTPTYVLAAKALDGEGSVNPMYRERILLPILLHIANRAGADPTVVLWLVILLEWPATMAVGYVGWALTARRSVGVLAAALYVLHPDTYQNAVLLQTDLMHVQWVMMALACTLGFVRERRPRLVGVAGLFWMLAQLTRPTFFTLIAAYLIPTFAWRKDRRLFRGFACLAALSLVVPAGFAAANAARFGIPSPSLCLAEMLETWTVPRARALLVNDESPAPMRRLFEDEVNKVRATTRWRVLHGLEGTAEDFRREYRGALASNVAFLVSHPSVTFQASRAELLHEIMTVPTFHHADFTTALNGAYPDPSRWIGLLYKAGLLFCLAAIPVAFRGKNWPLFFFMAALVALVLGPASLSWWCCGRYRFNVNIIVLPLVAAGVLHPAGWLALAGTFVFGYAPARIFHLPPLFIAGVALVSLAASWDAVARWQRGKAVRVVAS